MYFVSPEYANKKPQTQLPHLKSGSRKKRVIQKQHPHDKWVKMRHEMGEADISRKALIQKIADFLQTDLPGNALVKSKIRKLGFTEHPPSPMHTDTTSVWASPASLPSTSHEIIYETPKRSEEEEEEGPVTCRNLRSQSSVLNISDQSLVPTFRLMPSALGMWIKISGFEGRPTEVSK